MPRWVHDVEGGRRTPGGRPPRGGRAVGGPPHRGRARGRAGPPAPDRGAGRREPRRGALRTGAGRGRPGRPRHGWPAGGRQRRLRGALRPGIPHPGRRSLAAEILAELDRRLDNDDRTERDETIQQLGEIAVLRSRARCDMSERLLVTGGTVVTMDGDRSEYADGNVLVEDGRMSSVGSGPALTSRTRASSTPAAASSRPASSTPTTISTMGDARPRGRRDALRVADDALPGVGLHRRGVGVAAATAGLGWLARPAARRRSTTTTSSRPTAATCWPRRSRPRAPWACGSCRPAARWTSAGRRAACRRTTSSRTSTRSSPPRPMP